jgi:glutamine amidotransferase
VIGVVDYGMGNRRSVDKALQHVGARTVVSSDPIALRRAGGLVVPGVGAFPAGMSSLRALGLDDLLRERATAGIPILGICLGMQLLFEDSEELGGADGLGLIPGRVRGLRAEGLSVPHIGWNEVRLHRACRVTSGLPGDRRPFYHVHSFVARPEHPEDTIGSCVYGEEFASIVARDAVFGVQFHPEKSSRDGLAILSAFVALAAQVPAVSAA